MPALIYRINISLATQVIEALKYLSDLAKIMDNSSPNTSYMAILGKDK